MTIEDYNIRRNDREKKQGGGAMILTNKELQVKQLCLDVENEVEMVSIELKTTEGDVIIANVYVSPNKSLGEG